MPIQPLPTFKSVPDKMLDIPQPAIGGLNLKDLEFEQNVNQSPYMLNVMYRNGAFGKRYGQNLIRREDNSNLFEYEILNITYFKEKIIVHAGSYIYSYVPESNPVQIGQGFSSTEKGLFIVYAQKLYFLDPSGFYVANDDVTSWSAVQTYVPEVLINCKPDGTGGDSVDDFNLIGSKFSLVFNGDGTSTTYDCTTYDKTTEYVIDWTKPITATVDDDPKTITVSNKKITFATAPASGDMNVVITFTMKANTFSSEKAQILSCKYYDTFGGANNSRLFLAGGGQSKYFFSQAYDITYFPEGNFATLGNTEEDITGFGRQYNVLIVFKPREIYSVYSYTESSTTTIIEENIGLEGFKSQLVNARVGCDAPNSIQLINNLLTWFNSREGICTLVSTNVQDERNVRLLSRNIDRTNNFGIVGILDHAEDPATVQSVDYNNKYFLVFPTSGDCFIWDYEISPYRYSTSGGETNPRDLDWFLFDHFNVKQFLKVGKALYYASICGNEKVDRNLVKLHDGFYDISFDNMEEPWTRAPIESYYMTPFMQFGAVEMLKNVKNIYVQTRGDTASVIDMYYYTEESQTPEQEGESIRLGGRLWEKFQWANFQWMMVSWANTFRRKCNLKKIQMASFFFTNNEVDRDMSITHVGLQYSIVKYVR